MGRMKQNEEVCGTCGNPYGLHFGTTCPDGRTTWSDLKPPTRSKLKVLQVISSDHGGSFTDAERDGAVYEVDISENTSEETVRKVAQCVTNCLGMDVTMRIATYSAPINLSWL